LILTRRFCRPFDSFSRDSFCHGLSVRLSALLLLPALLPLLLLLLPALLLLLPALLPLLLLLLLMSVRRLLALLRLLDEFLLCVSFVENVPFEHACCYSEGVARQAHPS
jgi:hypothetical protein